MHGLHALAFMRRSKLLHFGSAAGRRRRLRVWIPLRDRQSQGAPAVQTRMARREKEYCAVLMILAVLSACNEHRHPPPALSFGGLPVSGSLADAHHAGLNDCIAFDVNMRCRRDGVMFLGKGPYNAAVDLDGSDGSGGFGQLTLWDDKDQDAVLAIADDLKRRGWLECLGGGRGGDQAIYTHKNSAVFVSMDVSYWSKRRLRVIPTWNTLDSRCAGQP
jgi:hypothetical protein